MFNMFWGEGWSRRNEIIKKEIALSVITNSKAGRSAKERGPKQLWDAWDHWFEPTTPKSPGNVQSGRLAADDYVAKAFAAKGNRPKAKLADNPLPTM